MSLKDIAKEFVNRYLNQSPEAAAYYAMDTVGDEDFEELSNYITEEFSAQGYELK